MTFFCTVKYTYRMLAKYECSVKARPILRQTNNIYLVQEVDIQQVVQVGKLLVVQEEDSLQRLVVLQEVHSLQLHWDCMAEVAFPSSRFAPVILIR